MPSWAEVVLLITSVKVKDEFYIAFSNSMTSIIGRNFQSVTSITVKYTSWKLPQETRGCSEEVNVF